MKRTAWFAMCVLPFLAGGCQESAEPDHALTSSALEQQNDETADALPSDKAGEAPPSDSPIQPEDTPVIQPMCGSDIQLSDGIYGLLTGGKANPAGAQIFLSESPMICTDKVSPATVMQDMQLTVELSRLDNGTYEINGAQNAYGCDNEGALKASLLYRNPKDNKVIRAQSGWITITGVTHASDKDWLEQPSISVAFEVTLDVDGTPLHIKNTVSAAPCAGARNYVSLACP